MPARPGPGPCKSDELPLSPLPLAGWPPLRVLCVCPFAAVAFALVWACCSPAALDPEPWAAAVVVLLAVVDAVWDAVSSADAGRVGPWAAGWWVGRQRCRWCVAVSAVVPWASGWGATVGLPALAAGAWATSGEAGAATTVVGVAGCAAGGSCVTVAVGPLITRKPSHTPTAAMTTATMANRRRVRRPFEAGSDAAAGMLGPSPLGQGGGGAEGMGGGGAEESGGRMVVGASSPGGPTAKFRAAVSSMRVRVEGRSPCHPEATNPAVVAVIHDWHRQLAQVLGLVGGLGLRSREGPADVVLELREDGARRLAHELRELGGFGQLHRLAGRVAERAGELARGRGAPARVSPQRLGDDLGDLLRDFRPRPAQGRDRHVGDALELGEGVVGGEEATARERLPGDHTEGEDVGAPVDGASGGLLGERSRRAYP